MAYEFDILATLRDIRASLRTITDKSFPPGPTGRLIEARNISVASVRSEFERIYVPACYGIKIVNGGASDTFIVLGGDRPDPGATSTTALGVAHRASNNIVLGWDAEPIHWIWVRNYSASTTPLTLHIDRVPMRKQAVDDSGASTTSSFSDAQPIYPSRDGSSTSAGLPVFFGGLSGAALSTQPIVETGALSSLTPLHSIAIPFTPSSDTTTRLKHVIASTPVMTLAHTATTLAGSATYTSQTLPISRDAGAVVISTENRIGTGFGLLSAGTYASHAGNGYIDVLFGASGNWRQLATYVVAAATVVSDHRVVAHANRARHRFVNDGTANTTFEHGVQAYPRLSGYNNA